MPALLSESLDRILRGNHSIKVEPDEDLNFVGYPRPNLNRSILSAGSADWDGLTVLASTATLRGSTNITTATGFNLVDFERPTITSPNAITVTNAATVRIAHSPLAAGSTTITNPYSLWVDDGATRLDGILNVTGLITSNGGLNITGNNVLTIGADAADSGLIRLPNNTSLSWRNDADSGNLTLKVNTDDKLQFSGAVVVDGNLTVSGTYDAITTDGIFRTTHGLSAVPGAVDDDAPTAKTLQGAHASAEAVTAGNKIGGDVRIYAGVGQRTLTVEDFAEGGTDTITLTINGSATVLTEGLEFNAETDNNTTATNIAAAIEAVSGVSAVATDADIAITPDITTRTLLVESSDAGFVSVAVGADGLVDVSSRDVAASETATLTNSPKAGNPAEWIVIKVNGAERTIPVWLLA